MPQSGQSFLISETQGGVTAFDLDGNGSISQDERDRGVTGDQSGVSLEQARIDAGQTSIDIEHSEFQLDIDAILREGADRNAEKFRENLDEATIRGFELAAQATDFNREQYEATVDKLFPENEQLDANFLENTLRLQEGRLDPELAGNIIRTGAQRNLIRGGRRPVARDLLTTAHALQRTGDQQAFDLVSRNQNLSRSLIADPIPLVGTLLTQLNSLTTIPLGQQLQQSIANSQLGLNERGQNIEYGLGLQAIALQEQANRDRRRNARNQLLTDLGLGAAALAADYFGNQGSSGGVQQAERYDFGDTDTYLNTPQYDWNDFEYYDGSPGNDAGTSQGIDYLDTESEFGPAFDEEYSYA